VASKVINKQSRTAEKGGPPVWGGGGLVEVITASQNKNIGCYKAFYNALNLDLSFDMTQALEKERQI
jgi:hypothetical protein